MRELTVELGDRSYPILVGAGVLADCEALAALAAGRGVAVVTDSNVAALHGRRVADALRRERLTTETAQLRDMAGEISWAKVTNVSPADYPAIAADRKSAAPHSRIGNSESGGFLIDRVKSVNYTRTK